MIVNVSHMFNNPMSKHDAGSKIVLRILQQIAEEYKVHLPTAAEYLCGVTGGKDLVAAYAKEHFDLDVKTWCWAREDGSHIASGFNIKEGPELTAMLLTIEEKKS